MPVLRLLPVLVLLLAGCRSEPAERPPADTPPAALAEITPAALAARLDGAAPPLVLDVRTPAEYARGHVPGAVNLPHTEVAAHLDTLSTGREVVLYCQSGGRARMAAEVLRGAGFTRLAHLTGDLPGWVAAGQPVAR